MICFCILMLRFAPGRDGGSESALDTLLASKAPDEEMFRYLPNNSHVIVFIRARSVAKSEAFRELSRRLPDPSKWENAFEESTGLPPSQMKRVVLSLRPGNILNASEIVLVCRTDEPIKAADIIANMKHSMQQDEKVRSYTIYTSNVESFCIVRNDLILFGPTATVREILLRDSPPELSSGMETAMRVADFSKDIAYVANAKDMLRKYPWVKSAGLLWSPELRDALIRTDAAAGEVSFGREIDSRETVFCKDIETARELISIQKELAAKIKADTKSSPAMLRVLASTRWSLEGSRIIETSKTDVDTYVEFVQQNQMSR
jgi:hypothetical protein